MSPRVQRFGRGVLGAAGPALAPQLGRGVAARVGDPDRGRGERHLAEVLDVEVVVQRGTGRRLHGPDLVDRDRRLPHRRARVHVAERADDLIPGQHLQRPEARAGRLLAAPRRPLALGRRGVRGRIGRRDGDLRERVAPRVHLLGPRRVVTGGGDEHPVVHQQVEAAGIVPWFELLPHGQPRREPVPEVAAARVGHGRGVDRPVTAAERPGGERAGVRAAPVARAGVHQLLAQRVAAAGRPDVVEHVVPGVVGDGPWLAVVEHAVAVVVREDLEPRQPRLTVVALPVRVAVEELGARRGAGARVDRLRRDVVLHVRGLRGRRARVHPDRRVGQAVVAERVGEHLGEVDARLAEAALRDLGLVRAGQGVGDVARRWVRPGRRRRP